MKELLSVIVREMVDYPEQVQVQESLYKEKIFLELSVAQKDMGKVLGRGGQNIKAIRWILRSASAKINKQVIVRVMEPSRSS